MASEDAELRIARWEREQTTCHFHGGPIEECGDDDLDWFPQRRICWPTAQLAAANRRFDELHKDEPYHDGLEQIWSDKPSLLTPFHYRDGVTVYLARTDESPEDDFLNQGGDDVFNRTAPAD